MASKYRGDSWFFAGSNSIYVSNSIAAPFAHQYDIYETSTVHFYKDITFLAGETTVNLSFDYLVQGEGSSTMFDYLRVYLVPTTYTPTANALIPNTKYYYSVTASSGSTSTGPCTFNNFTTTCAVYNAP